MYCTCYRHSDSWVQLLCTSLIFLLSFVKNAFSMSWNVLYLLWTFRYWSVSHVYYLNFSNERRAEKTNKYFFSQGDIFGCSVSWSARVRNLWIGTSRSMLPLICLDSTFVLGICSYFGMHHCQSGGVRTHFQVVCEVGHFPRVSRFLLHSSVYK